MVKRYARDFDALTRDYDLLVAEHEKTEAELAAMTAMVNEAQSAAVTLSLKLGTAETRIAALEAALRAAKIPHLTCEDCWYSCPMSAEGCCDEREKECNCGALSHNACIDSALETEGDPNPLDPSNHYFRKCLKGHVAYSISFPECPSCKIVRERDTSKTAVKP